MIHETPEATRRERVSNDKIETVTGATFNTLVLDAEGPVAVEFMSYGCAHCRVMEPVLQQVVGMVPSEEKIFRVNVAVEQELAASYEIRGTPTLILFLNGGEVGRIEGPSPSVAGVLAEVTRPFES